MYCFINNEVRRECRPWGPCKSLRSADRKLGHRDSLSALSVKAPLTPWSSRVEAICPLLFPGHYLCPLSLSLIHTYTSCSCPPSSTSQPHGDPTSHASSPKPTPALPRAGPPSWAHSFIMLPRPHPSCLRPELGGDFLSPKPASNSPLWDRVLVPSPLVYMFQSWAGLGCPQLVPAEAGCVELPS